MPDEAAPIEHTAASVLAALPCSVTLAAGSGKTELLAAVVAQIAAGEGRTLVLTHTHAGVAALKRRMAKFNVGSSAVAVRTIDSWAFDLIGRYPLLAGLQAPDVPDWSQSVEYHRAATRAVASRAIRRMLQVSYDALLVDEYQDCLIDQHHLIVAMAEAIPTAVFGDPAGPVQLRSERPGHLGDGRRAPFQGVPRTTAPTPLGGPQSGTRHMVALHPRPA